MKRCMQDSQHSMVRCSIHNMTQHGMMSSLLSDCIDTRDVLNVATNIIFVLFDVNVNNMTLVVKTFQLCAIHALLLVSMFMCWPHNK